MAHIQNTLLKKQLVAEALERPDKKYLERIEKARKQGFTDEQIIVGLNGERKRILKDIRNIDDPIFQQGVDNAKMACLASLELIIRQLKGDHNGNNLQS